MVTGLATTCPCIASEQCPPLSHQDPQPDRAAEPPTANELTLNRAPHGPRPWDNVADITVILRGFP